MMKRTSQVTLYLSLACAFPVVFPQQQVVDSGPSKVSEGIHRSDLPALQDAVRKDDPFAASLILQTGRTDDSFWVPYLEPILKKKHRLGLVNDAGAAQMALARLGQKEQLQEIGCEADFGSASSQNKAFAEKLKYVQGWFSIQILKGWIDDSAKPTPLLVDRPGDQVFIGPQLKALEVLPEIVANSPFSAPIPIGPWLLPQNQDKLTRLRQGWLEWISRNDDSLRKLTPSGEGLDLSPVTCRRVLAHDRHFDRSTLK